MRNIKNPMVLMLIVMIVLFACLFGYHEFKNYKNANYLEEKKHAPVTVATYTVGYNLWPQKLKGLGSLRAAQGIEVTSEVDGLVTGVYFKSNQQVKAGDVLVQLNADPDIGLLDSLLAEQKNAEVIYERDKIQYEFKAISKEVLDEDEYNLGVQTALVEQQLAIVDQKSIRAPFDGMLGISSLNKGHFLSAGDPIVSLQNLDYLYVDFSTPEQNLKKLKVGQTVELFSDAYHGQSFSATVSGIDPLIDVDTRNINIEAIVPNQDRSLYPGMYAKVEVTIGEPKSFLTIPQSAVTYNPYGNSVYVVHKDDKKENKKDKTQKLYVKQRFVELGEKRGDQVQVLKGLKEKEQIVAAGQVKIKNNSPIIINNKIVPTSDAKPKVSKIPEN